jgi:hypothetical protein
MSNVPPAAPRRRALYQQAIDQEFIVPGYDHDHDDPMGPAIGIFKGLALVIVLGVALGLAVYFAVKGIATP